PPHHFPRQLVHGQEATAALALIAPARVEHADDDEIVGHERTGDAAAVAANAPVFFGERALPKDLAVAVETEKGPLRALDVDIAGLGIAREVGPAQAH